MNNIFKYFLTLMFVISVGFVASAQTVSKKKVAVYMTGTDIDENYKKVIGSKLVTGITRSDSYAAVERTADFLAELDKEQGYQLSGAVSDNQIAQIGQQFGVNYVLVADIAEVFDSMFISARMIDVQTAQITSSTETSGVVNNIESLSKLAENIVLEIVGVPAVSEDDVTQKSVLTFDDLYKCQAPSGYHIATHDEIIKIIQNYQMTGKKIYYPVYTDVTHDYKMLKQYFTVDYYKNNDWNAKIIKTDKDHRYYSQYSVTCRAITSATENTVLYLVYVDDSGYYSCYNNNNRPADKRYYKKVSVGIDDMNQPKPNITAGYVYFVKDK